VQGLDFAVVQAYSGPGLAARLVFGRRLSNLDWGLHWPGQVAHPQIVLILYLVAVSCLRLEVERVR
jgi:hypothetical protein